MIEAGLRPVQAKFLPTFDQTFTTGTDLSTRSVVKLPKPNYAGSDEWEKREQE